MTVQTDNRRSIYWICVLALFIAALSKLIYRSDNPSSTTWVETHLVKGLQDWNSKCADSSSRWNMGTICCLRQVDSWGLTPISNVAQLATACDGKQTSASLHARGHR